MKHIKVLYIDDEENNLHSFRSTFRKTLDIYTAISPEEGRKILKKIEDIAIVLVDFKMPIENGIEFFASMMKDYPNPTRIMITAYADTKVLTDAINRCHIFNLILKPWDLDLLTDSIHAAYEQYRTKKEDKKTITHLLKANRFLQDFVNNNKRG
jgi:two-component system response regulator PhcR